MDVNIGTTTTDISVADEVRLFKSRVIRGGREEKQPETPRRASKTASIAKNSNKAVAQRYNAEPLSTLCLKVIAENFSARPILHVLSDKQIPKLTSLLDLDLNIKVAAANIYDENYWKRRAARKNWKHFELSNHGMTWKQLYLERTLEQLLEDYVPEDVLLEERGSVEEKQGKVTEDQILEHLEASQDYVFQLRIGQLLSHLDLNVLFDSLPNLSRLELTFGVKKIGMQYDRSLFGMKLCDATSLACAIKKTCTLTSLSLPCNQIDDDLLRMLMTGLISNSTITHLDLSHNKITNHGVRLLSKLLGPKSVLSVLDLCDNQIHVEGGRYLGRVLKRNRSLLELNLRLNRLSDEGGALLCEGLLNNSSLAILNLSSNSLAGQTAKAVAQALESPVTGLNALDLSCNELVEEDGELLLHALKKRCTLVSLDVRKNILTESAKKMGDIVKRNELQTRRENLF